MGKFPQKNLKKKENYMMDAGRFERVYLIFYSPPRPKAKKDQLVLLYFFPEGPQTSTALKHRPHRKINHTETSTTPKHRPHRNIDHTELNWPEGPACFYIYFFPEEPQTSTASKHRPHRNIDHTETSTTPKHRSYRTKPAQRTG